MAKLTSNTRNADWEVVSDEEVCFRSALVRIANLREEIAHEQPPGVAAGVELAAKIAREALTNPPRGSDHE